MVTEELPVLDTEIDTRKGSEVRNLNENLPEYIFICSEGLAFGHRMELPNQFWEPMLGGEFTEHLWDKILVEPGDTAVIQGSSVLKMMIGYFPLDPKDFTIPKDMRTDLDIVVIKPKVLARLKNVEGTEGRRAFKFEHDGLKADILDINQIFEQHRDILNFLDENDQTANSNPDTKSEYTEFIRNNYRDPLWAIEYAAFQKHETLSVIMQRGEDGKLHATLNDPEDIMVPGMQRMFTGNMAYQILSGQTKYGINYPLYVTDINLMSPKCFLFEGLKGLADDTPLSSKVALYALDAIPRMIRTAAEQEINNMGIGEPYLALFYDDIGHMATRLSKGHCPLKVSPELFSEEERALGIEDTLTWFKNRLQTVMARSMASDPIVTMGYMTIQLPLGNFISEDIGSYYDSYFKTNFPSSTLQRDIEIDRDRKLFPEDYAQFDDMLSVFAVKYKDTEGKVVPYDEIPQIQAFMKFMDLYNAIYGMGYISAFSRYTESGEVLIKKYEKQPSSVSEVMSIYLYSLGWDPDKQEDIEKIDKMVGNWMPKGNVPARWKLSRTEFETSMDKHTILEGIRKVKLYVEELENEQTAQNEQIASIR